MIEEIVIVAHINNLIAKSLSDKIVADNGINAIVVEPPNNLIIIEQKYEQVISDVL
jgi:hypothetical protein